MDISENRHAVKYSRKIQFLRILWGVLGKPLFRFSPRTAFGWRRFILRLFGAKVGKKVNIYSSAIIYFPWNLEIGDWSSIGEHALIYTLGSIKIGKSVTISQYAHLCAGTHDYKDPAMPLLTPPITVEDQVWVCAEAFVSPGRTIHEGAVVGARSVVTRDVEAWAIVAGNPAFFIKKRKMKRD